MLFALWQVFFRAERRTSGYSGRAGNGFPLPQTTEKGGSINIGRAGLTALPAPNPEVLPSVQTEAL